jgi:hypothetical protein
MTLLTYHTLHVPTGRPYLLNMKQLKQEAESLYGQNIHEGEEHFRNGAKENRVTRLSVFCFLCTTVPSGVSRHTLACPRLSYNWP